MMQKERARRSDESPALFQVMTAYYVGLKPQFYAKSLVNEWRGINRSTADEAREDGKMHAEALRFLFSGRLR